MEELTRGVSVWEPITFAVCGVCCYSNRLFSRAINLHHTLIALVPGRPRFSLNCAEPSRQTHLQHNELALMTASCKRSLYTDEQTTTLTDYYFQQTKRKAIEALQATGRFRWGKSGYVRGEVWYSSGMVQKTVLLCRVLAFVCLSEFCRTGNTDMYNTK